jgi:uncharacterized YccA/Bax inhibitor family protein
MEASTKNLARQRYRLRALAALSLYTVFLVADLWTFRHHHPAVVCAWLLAILPALPIIAVLAAFGLYLVELKDEFQRMIKVQSMLWSIGATLAVTTVWGFLESFVQAPHLESIWIYPIFCFFMAISVQLVKLRYR